MICRVATHHTGAHWGSKAIFCRRVRICLTYFRMISETQVIIQAPYDLFYTAELHAVAYFPFQLWKGKIAGCFFCIIANRTEALFKLCKDVCHINLEFGVSCLE